MKIILITGRARSGKDTAAETIRQTFEAEGKRVLTAHYADLVKYICRQFFGWNGEKDEAGRTLLQKVGTDCVRKRDPDYWVRFISFMLECFGSSWDYVVIPDCRFPNEHLNLVQDGFDVTLLRIIRPGFYGGLTAEQRSHPSETEQDKLIPDVTIVNDGTEGEYKDKIRTWLKETFNED